jgi:hypothetical protein
VGIGEGVFVFVGSGVLVSVASGDKAVVASGVKVVVATSSSFESKVGVYGSLVAQAERKKMIKIRAVKFLINSSL